MPFALLLLVLALPASAQKSATPQAAHPAATAQRETTPVGQASADQRLAGAQEDLRRMRSLLEQMQNNLAFVSDTQSPLKHQFELDIEMWRALVDHMQREIAPPGTSPTKP